jgi:acyl carrier protein
MDTFPVTSSGKLDRQALPRPGRAGPDLDTPFVAPRTEQEQQIADIWAELLGLDAVGVEDNFYDLGGDSILALRMALAVEQVTGRRVPPDFFRTPRIAYLADPAANTPAPVSLEPSPDRRRTAADKARSLLRLTPHRVVRRLAYDGPVWGEHGLPYTMGTRIQHLLCRNRFFQQQVFAQECAIFHTWLEATRQVDDEPVLLTRHLMANTWLQWRRATLRSSEQWAKIVAITGAELLDRRQRQGRGVVLVVPHYADSIWIRRSVEGYEPIHIFRGAGQSATDEQRTRLHSERLVDANLVLARGGVVLIAIDSTHGKRGVEVPFFGYKMPFRSGAAELAATTGADMVFATWRLGVDGRMTVDFRTAPGGQEGDHECKVDDLLNQYATLMTAAWPVLLPSLSFGALYSNTVSLPRLDG